MISGGISKYKYPSQYRYQQRKRAERIAQGNEVKARYAQTLNCKFCGEPFARHMTQNGRPRQNESLYCSKLCAARIGVAPRQCCECGVNFTPKHNGQAVFCSQRCKKREWWRRPYVRQRYKLREPEESAALQQARARKRCLKRVLAIVKLLRKMKRQQEQQPQPMTCKVCAVRFMPSRFFRSWCSYHCREIAEKAAKRRRKRIARKRAIAELGDQYVKRAIQKTTGLRPSRSPSNLVDVKRQQLMLVRSIRGVRNAINETGRRSD